MTRPFGLHDLGLLWSLRGQGVTLDMQRAVLYRTNPLQTALTGLLPALWAGNMLTFVCRSQRGSRPGLLQVLASPERREWQVVHLSPWLDAEKPSADPGWVSALVDLCMLAGQWGAMRVRAGVAAGGAAEEAFRQAGFAAYAREAVYAMGTACPLRAAPTDLRPLAPEDAWPLIQLVGQVVPPSVQHAEGMTVSDLSVPTFSRLGVNREQGFVLERGGDLRVYVGLSRAAQGAWARILLHPDLRGQAPAVALQMISLAAPAIRLYCAIRDYQAGLRGVLEEMGFDFLGSQVWLVKHTTRPAECRRLRHRATLDKRAEPVTTPLFPVNNSTAQPCPWMAREHSVHDYGRTDGYAVRSD